MSNVKWESGRGGNAWCISDSRYTGKVFRAGPMTAWASEICGEPGEFFRRRVDAKRHVECEIAKPSVAWRCPF